MTMIIGTAFFGGDQIVEDQIGVALENPAGLVFAHAVLKIQHRIARG